MNDLKITIDSLNKDEIRHYKVFANRTTSLKKRKDITLFNIIREKKESYNEESICKYFYKDKKNNFYQLKNKLLENINKSLVIQHSNKEKDILTFNMIFISKIHTRKGNLKIAFKYLKKAEYIANKIENFEALSIIYSQILNLSCDLISINLEKYIKRKNYNKKKIDMAHNIDVVLSSVMYKIKTTQNFSKNDDEALKILDNILNPLYENKEISQSPSFKIKAFKTISRILLQKNDFIALEKYLKKTYHAFTTDNIFNKDNHEQKLMLLTYLSNSLYKNNKYKESLDTAKILKKAMEEYDGILKDNYMFYYYNTLVINYSSLDKNKALKVLMSAKDDEKIQKLPTFSVFIYLNIALLYYDQKKYTLSIKNISRLILQDDFPNLSIQFRLKILVSEIIIRHKLNQIDQIEEKIDKLEKQYKKELIKNKREKIILKIIRKLIYCNNLRFDKKILEEIKKLKKIKKGRQEEIIDYDEWIASL